MASRESWKYVDIWEKSISTKWQNKNKVAITHETSGIRYGELEGREPERKEYEIRSER